MEDLELEQRIRAMQRIYGAEGVPEPGARPLPGAQILALAQFMTPEEVLEELKRVCATLDKTILDNMVKDKMILQQHENQQKQEELHAREKQAYEREIAEKDDVIKSKDAVIKSNEEKIRTLESELRDKRHSEESLKEEKFAGKSKRGIDKTKTTSKGRDDNKDDFDGTPDSATQNYAEQTTREDFFEDTKPVSRDRIQKIKKERASKYTLADASEIEDYYCDMSQLPEGAVVIDEDQDLTDVIFDEVRTIIARRYHYVRYKIKEEVIDEDGNKSMQWRVYTMHLPKIDENGKHKAEKPIRRHQNPLPSQVPGTHETPELLANLLFEHYFCNVPMNRISKGFGEFGFKIRRSTLENLDSTTANILKPIYEALKNDVLKDDAVIFCDETWGRLHLKDVTKKVYSWIIGNKKDKCVVYVYDNGSRGRKVIVEVLYGRRIKAIHTDGYNAYYFLQDTNITHICCGAHLWRKLKEWYERTKDPEARSLLMDLQWLFGMDARLREKNAPPEEVLLQRNSPETLNIISRFTARVDLLLEKCRDIPKIGYKALTYAKEIGAKVFRWREDADYELDNNFAERSARPFATARKTSFFHCSHEGAENECIIRSFFETCRLRDVPVVGWFKAFFKAMIQGRTDYENLLPGVLPLN